MLDCFKIGNITYEFFKKHNSLNLVYPYFFKSINYGIKYFTEKNYDMLAEIIYKSLIDKPEIKLSDNCFLVNDIEYFINDIVFQKVKGICNVKQ